MQTVKVDAKQRVRLPNVKPGQVFVLSVSNDTITLTKVEAERKEPFPPGSLIKEVEEWDKEFAPMAAKMVVPTPEDD